MKHRVQNWGFTSVTAGTEYVIDISATGISNDQIVDIIPFRCYYGAGFIDSSVKYLYRGVDQFSFIPAVTANYWGSVRILYKFQ